MPRHRPPREVWDHLRERVLARDGHGCVRCGVPVSATRKHGEPPAPTKAHIDHIVSGKLGTNKLANLRMLCQRCHVLRSDHCCDFQR